MRTSAYSPEIAELPPGLLSTMEGNRLIKSMTGYGRAVQVFSGLEITAEIRAVNNRYLDCTVKLPRLYSYAEDPIKQRVKASVARGKVDVLFTIAHPAGTDATVQLNRPVVEGYLRAMGELVREYGVRDDIAVSTLARLPDVFTLAEPEKDEEAQAAALLAAAENALAQFNAMRTAEGAALEADLRARSKTILDLVSQVEARSPQAVAEYREKLEARMQEILAGAVDENRILTEAAIYADKVAVDEETVRLRSHLKQMDAMLTAGGTIGRKLDFLVQEMNRETNTIGSKCSDLALSQIVVEIKAELEKIREQIQNIE